MRAICLHQKIEFNEETGEPIAVTFLMARTYTLSVIVFGQETTHINPSDIDSFFGTRHCSKASAFWALVEKIGLGNRDDKNLKDAFDA